MAEVVSMPKLGFDMAEGTLIRWVVQEGETIAKGAVLAEIETDKATVEVESEFEGVVLKHLAAVEAIVPVNTAIAVIGSAGEEVNLEELLGEETPTAEAEPAAEAAAPEASPAPAAEPAQAVDSRLPGGVKASPLARRMASDMGVNLSQVSGSGPGGRIVKKDVEAYMKAPQARAAAPTPTAAPAPILSGAPLEREVVPLNRLRAAIGRRMTEAKQQLPHFYVTYDYDMAPLIELRKKVNAALPEEDKISVNDFIIKAVALTLRQYPNLNASLDGDQIVRHGEVNIGVAVAVEGGLLTIVSRDTDRKPLRMIASEVRTMVGRARDGKVRPDDIEGSTFSVSNLGMYGVDEFIAIINPPEAAILAVGGARQVPVVVDGEVKPGLRMKATISVDHRVSDGAEAARFMQSLAEFIEKPLSLLL